VTASSDLDLLQRPTRLPVRATLMRLHVALRGLPARADCQIETDDGAIVLSELLSGASEVLVRTPTGPRLRRVRADAGAVLDDLAQAVARPVQWYDAMRLMPGLGATCAVQMPPGHALPALVAGSAPSMYALALEDEGIERAVAAGAAI
jgi:Phosphoribosyl-dephospho-CoA transferase MdcG